MKVWTHKLRKFKAGWGGGGRQTNKPAHKAAFSFVIKSGKHQDLLLDIERRLYESCPHHVRAALPALPVSAEPALLRTSCACSCLQELVNQPRETDLSILRKPSPACETPCSKTREALAGCGTAGTSRVPTACFRKCPPYVSGSRGGAQSLVQHRPDSQLAANW